MEVLKGTAEGDAASSTFEFLDLITKETRRDLSADDPRVGRLGVSLKAGLEELPEGVSLESTIKKELTDEERTGVELLARERGKVVANEAGTVSVVTTNLDNETDINQATMTMKISANWVDAYGVENVIMSHVSDDGETEFLSADCTGPDDKNEYTCEATTDQGLSEFSLLALVDIPPAFAAKDLVIEPTSLEPGETVKITVDIVNEGVEAGSFSAILKLKKVEEGAGLEALGVQEITLAGGETGQVTFFIPTQEAEEGNFEVEIEGRVGEFLRGSYSVFEKLDPAALTFSDLRITPTDVLPNQLVTIRMLVLNAGDKDGTVEVEFRVNDVLSEIRFVSVPGNGEVEALFEFAPPAEGTFTAELIDAEELVPPVRGDFTATVPLAPATFILERPDISPLEVEPGEELTVTVQFANFGEQPGIMAIAILFNEKLVATQEVTRDALVSAPLTFTVSAPEEPGDYTVTLEGIVLVGDADVLPAVGAFKVLEIEVLEEVGEVVERVARLRVQRLSVAPDPVISGQPVVLSVIVENPDEVKGTRTLTIELDDEVIVPEVVIALGPGETKTETFTFDAPVEVGLHTLLVAGIAREFKVIQAPKRLAPAALSMVSPLSVSPRRPQPGELVIIVATIKNVGDEDGTTDVLLRIRGRVVDTRTVLVPGLQQVRLRFEVRRADAGSYGVEVEAVSGVDVPLLTGAFTVAAPAVARLAVVPETLKVDPDTVNSGQPVTISIDVRNSGTARGSRTVVFIVDGNKVEEREVFLEAGGTSTESLTLVERGIGTHVVAANGATAEFEVTRPVSLSVTVWLLVVFGLLVAGMAALIYHRAVRGGSVEGT